MPPTALATTGRPIDPASTSTVGSPSPYDGRTRTSAADMIANDVLVGARPLVEQTPRSARIVSSIAALGAVSDEHPEERVAKVEDRRSKLPHAFLALEVADEQNDQRFFGQSEPPASLGAGK